MCWFVLVCVGLCFFVLIFMLDFVLVCADVLICVCMCFLVLSCAFSCADTRKHISTFLAMTQRTLPVVRICTY